MICKWFAKYDESAAIAANFLRFGSRPYPCRGTFLVLALRVAFRADRSGHPDDRGHNRRRLGGSCALSNRAQRHRRRQWLRHDVLSLDPGPHRFDIASLVVVDFRFAFCCELDVLCRLVCRLGVAPVFLAEILGTAGIGNDHDRMSLWLAIFRFCSTTGRPTRSRRPTSALSRRPSLAPGPGEVLVRHTFLSLDPYMRGRLSDAKSYAKPQELGAVMGGGTVGIVEASNNPRFHPGDAVVGMGGWQRYSLSDGAMLRGRRRQGGSDPSLSRRAWHARRHRLVRPEQDHRAESGRDGRWSRRRPARSARWSASSPSSPAARTVGIAGGPEKSRLCRARSSAMTLCVDHKSREFRGRDESGACRTGSTDCSRTSAASRSRQAMRRLNDFARVAICGLIASVRRARRRPRPTCGIFLVKRFKMEGFIVSDHMEPVAGGDAASWPALAAAKQPDLARDDPRRPRERAAGAGRSCCAAGTSARCWSGWR